MNRYPLWKNLLVICALVFGLVYAMPNIYPPDPAVQFTSQDVNATVSQFVLDKALKQLDENGIPYKSSELTESSALIRLTDKNQQMNAQKIVKQAVGGDYVVALNKAQTTPDWLQSIGGKPMKLGLDLDGGVYFLLEVDTDAAIKNNMTSSASIVRSLLREDNNRYRSVEVDENNRIVAVFTREELRERARDIIGEQYPNFEYSYDQDGNNFSIIMTLSELEVREMTAAALTQNITSLNNRVNALGVAEPNVVPQGSNRIVVELPGVQDPAEAKRIIGRTANLEFRMEAKSGTPSSERETFPNVRGGYADLEKDVIISGDHVRDARAGFDPQTSQPQVSIKLDSEGGKLMNRATIDNVGRSMGTLFIEHKENVTYVDGEEKVERVIEREIINLANVLEPLSYDFQITGLPSSKEATELALLLRAGALAAPMYIREERTVSASLGQENIDAGVESVVLGMGVVLLFMLIYYRVFGFAANVALAANVVLIMAWLSLFGATLTLPGIAGIVLTVGMAVDANVLIFSRVKEELNNGSSPHQAINAGFDRAFVTILDSNITTLIVALILIAIGTGPVRGFAVTLSIGILTSMFTSIMVSRSLINLIYGGRRHLRKLWI